MAQLREDSSMLKLFTEHVKGEEMYGLTVHAVMRITESASFPFLYLCKPIDRGMIVLVSPAG